MSNDSFTLTDSRAVERGADLVSVSESGQKDGIIQLGERADVSVVFRLEETVDPAELSFFPDPALILYTRDIVRFVFR